MIALGLLAVGRGEMSSGVIKKALSENDRELAGATVAACGLTLKSVRYD